MSFSNFLKKLGDENGLAAYSDDQILAEVHKREGNDNLFPLDVFNEKIKPFINALNKEYDIPRSFIGLSLLSAYSTAIGTAYTVSTNNNDHICLSVWSCLLGISSSGKSLCLDKIYEPLAEIQNEFDLSWSDLTKELSKEQLYRNRLHTVMYRDSHIPTLLRSVLPDNPKGICKMSDELLEWINGLDALSKKEGTDVQFWLSTWNGKTYSAIRSGKDKFVIPRPFVNVTGGTQYSLVPRFFAKDRDTTGFIFRLLFAKPDVDKISRVNPFYDMPQEFYELHKKSLRYMYEHLPIEINTEESPKRCILTKEAVKTYYAWVEKKINFINKIEDRDERDIQSGILGKIKEYSLRFSALLHLADKSLNGIDEFGHFVLYNDIEFITKEQIIKALRLGDYFYSSAVDIYKTVQITNTAPAEVLTVAALLKMGHSQRSIAKAVYGKDDQASVQRMFRQIKKWISKYPRVFGAVAK